MLLAALFWLAVWEGAALLRNSELLLPGPLATARAFFPMVLTGAFWQTVGTTLLRVALGFLLGMAAGTALGVLTAFSPLGQDMLKPLAGIVKATPVTSIILLVLLWFRTSVTPICIAFLMVTPIFWATVEEGVLSTDRELLEMGRLFGFSRRKTLRELYVPSILPRYIAACSTALGFAWKSGVAAEVIAKPAFSIGRSIYESKLYVETPQLFAWTAAVVLLSMLLEKALVALLRRIRT